MITLIKLSMPGWAKKFNTEDEARVELTKYVCQNCMRVENLTEDSPLNDLLGTACGCEFMVE